MKTWRLDDGCQTLVLATKKDRLPEVVYWGAPLPDGEDLGTLQASYKLDVTGGMLDENPDLSLCPEATRSFPGQPGSTSLVVGAVSLKPTAPHGRPAFAIAKTALVGQVTSISRV